MDKPKVVKTAYVTGVFPDLPVPKATQDGRGEGSNIRVAASKAMVDLLRKPALRKRKITGARLTFVFGSYTKDVD